MLPAAADRTEKQNDLVAKYYAEYAALGLDECEIQDLSDKVYADNALSYLERACRATALARLEVEFFDFNPA